MVRIEDRILNLLESGPRTGSEMLNQLRVSKATLYKWLDWLVSRGKILEYPVKRGRNWMGLYCIPSHSKIAEQICGYSKLGIKLDKSRLLEALANLREILEEDPDLELLIHEMGGYPQDPQLRKTVYESALELGWKPPPREKLESQRALIQNLIQIARRLRSGEVKQFQLNPKLSLKISRLIQIHPEWI